MLNYNNHSYKTNKIKIIVQTCNSFLIKIKQDIRRKKLFFLLMIIKEQTQAQ